MIDTKVLREKILDLAMCGKLVPQDPNDEPASELLKRIKEEKEELITQKKIKRDKNETEIFRGDDGFYYEKFTDKISEKITVPYEIPQNWSWCRIATVTKNISAGGDKPKEVSMKRTDEFSYPIFSNGIKDNGLYGYSKEAKIFEKSVTVSARGTIGFTAIRNEPYTPIVRLISIIPPQGKLDVGFLKYMLSYLIPVGEGTSIPQLTVPGLKPFLIALPPYQEQLKIVEAINEYFILIDEIEENQKSFASLAEKLKKKVLDVAIQGKLVKQNPDDEPASVLLEKIRVEKQKLYEEGKLKKKDLEEKIIIKDEDDSYYGEIPESWELTTLGTAIQIINGDRGKNYPSKDKLHNEGEIPFISASNLENGNVSERDLKFLNDEQYELLSNGKLLKNDIALCIRGSLGKNGIFPFEKGAIASSLVILRSYSTSLVRQDFVFTYANSSAIYCEMKKYDNGTAQPNLAAKDLARFIFAIPPFNEQKRIVNKVTEVSHVLSKFRR